MKRDYDRDSDAVWGRGRPLKQSSGLSKALDAHHHETWNLSQMLKDIFKNFKKCVKSLCYFQHLLVTRGSFWKCDLEEHYDVVRVETQSMQRCLQFARYQGLKSVQQRPIKWKQKENFKETKTVIYWCQLLWIWFTSFLIKLQIIFAVVGPLRKASSQWKHAAWGRRRISKKRLINIIWMTHKKMVIFSM